MELRLKFLLPFLLMTILQYLLGWYSIDATSGMMSTGIAFWLISKIIRTLEIR